MFCLGGHLHKDLKVSRSYVCFIFIEYNLHIPVFTIRTRASDQTDVYFLL